MNTPPKSKPDGVQQKRIIAGSISDDVAALSDGGFDPAALPLHKASVAAAVYHYTVGVLRSQEIAARVKVDPAFAAWRVNGAPTAEDISRVRDEQPELLRKALINALSWSWKTTLRSQVTGVNTMEYAEKVVAGRQQEFQSHAEVETEACKRIQAAAAADIGE